MNPQSSSTADHEKRAGKAVTGRVSCVTSTQQPGNNRKIKSQKTNNGTCLRTAPSKKDSSQVRRFVFDTPASLTTETASLEEDSAQSRKSALLPFCPLDLFGFVHSRQPDNVLTVIGILTFEEGPSSSE